MNSRAPSKRITIVSLISIVFVVHLFQPLHSAKIATPTPQNPTTNPKTKRAKATVKPFAPIAPTTTTSETYMSEKKSQEVAAARQEKAAKQTTPIATGTPPATRNLIMLFDDGFDTAHMMGVLAAALTQKCAFILITPALWQLFCKKTVSDEKPVFLVDEALKKSLGKNLSYTSIFFVPSEWKTYQIDVVKNDVFFYLLVPNKYRADILGHGDPSDQILGLNLTALKTIDLPIIAPKATYSDNFRRDGNVAKALAQALVASRKRQIFNYCWNVYCTGHGDKLDQESVQFYNECIQKIEGLQKAKNQEAKNSLEQMVRGVQGVVVSNADELKQVLISAITTKQGAIANISIPSFKSLTQFLTTKCIPISFCMPPAMAAGNTSSLHSPTTWVLLPNLITLL